MSTRKIADLHVHFRHMDYEKFTGMLNDIYEEGVTNVGLQSLPYRGAAENLFALYMKLKYKKMPLSAFGGLHLTDRYAKVAPELQVKTLWEMGCEGIKLMFAPEIQSFAGKGLDHPDYEKMFAYLEENQIPVVIHLADPEEFWNKGERYDTPALPTKEEMYAQAFRMLDKHPRLRVCFAHFMFLSAFPEEATRVMEKYPCLCLDLTPGMEMNINFNKNLDFWRGFFTKYKKRILFGTDAGPRKNYNRTLENMVYQMLTEKGEFCPNCFHVEKLCGLGLDADTVKAISYDNYFDFVGKSLRPVNMEMFKFCLERIISDLDNEPYDEYYVRGGELIADLKADPEQRISYNFCKMALETI